MMREISIIWAGRILGQRYYLLNGLIEGANIKLFEKGSIADFANYKGGIKEGEEIFFFENGIPQRTAKRLNNKEYGEVFIHCNNGTPRLIIFMRLTEILTKRRFLKLEKKDIANKERQKISAAEEI